MSLKLSDIEDKLIDLLQKFSKNEELKLDIMAILCSLVKDEQYRSSKAEDDFATKLLMQEIETGSMRYVEYCLSYLRNRKVHLCKNEKALQGILRYIQISERIQYNMAAIFASACKFKVCGLKFVAALLYKSYGAAILLSGVSYNGVPLPVHLKECLSSGNVYIVQLYAAKWFVSLFCLRFSTVFINFGSLFSLIYFYRIKCLKDIRPFIIKKLIPTILQIISAPDNYVRRLLKAEACEALAYCIEDDPELQYMNKDVETIAAHIGSLKCISSIIGGNENIRRRVLGQIVDMDAYLLQMLTLEECPDDLKLAVYRCLLSMSRSVEQLRTVFHHCLICKALKDVILEYDFLATVCEWLHDDSHNLRLNAAWILMFTDELMSNHGATIIEIFLEVLRGNFEECCQEQVLYALANTATGVEARKQLLKNDAIFEMISKFINHCNAEMQIASVRCVHNLLMPRLGDVIGDAVLLDRILQKFNVVKNLKEVRSHDMCLCFWYDFFYFFLFQIKYFFDLYEIVDMRCS
ncbi:hypothetical protein D917_01180 [Trichinella nativa]|uniref:Armadillo repeat-containing protein 8 n=1 Tax=Trichinella nativa TaxID=6335 RepID=A0A1Y3ETJ9_9BILA|nr:hypothetical protein D917_01180 [Trichinella nativa]